MVTACAVSLAVFPSSYHLSPPSQQVAIGRNAGHELWRGGCKAALSWVQESLDALAAGQEQYTPSIALAAQTIKSIIANRQFYSNGTIADEAAWGELASQAVTVRPLACVCVAAAGAGGLIWLRSVRFTHFSVHVIGELCVHIVFRYYLLCIVRMCQFALPAVLVCA